MTDVEAVVGVTVKKSFVRDIEKVVLKVKKETEEALT